MSCPVARRWARALAWWFLDVLADVVITAVIIVVAALLLGWWSGIVTF